MNMIHRPNPALIIGLGNAEKKYFRTYHNVGHLFIDALSVNPELRIANLKILKNDDFMNTSGRFVTKSVQENNVPLDRVLIVHDDSDLELGTYKFSFGSGAAGHHGIENVIDALKTKGFWRLRIGIRKKPAGLIAIIAGFRKAGSFVLRPISTKDQKILDAIFQKSIAEIISMTA